MDININSNITNNEEPCIEAGPRPLRTSALRAAR